MAENDKDVVIPVIREELHADTIPVVTGGVRVTKRVESHDEVVEQELRNSSVDVNRIPMDQLVDGPQPVRRVGNTIVIPVVSEVFKGEKQSVITEEIHITERQQQETVQTTVTLNSERPQIDRLDAAGNVVSSNVASTKAISKNLVSNNFAPNDERSPGDAMKLSGESASILKGSRSAGADLPAKPSSLPATPSIFTNRPRKRPDSVTVS